MKIVEEKKESSLVININSICVICLWALLVVVVVLVMLALSTYETIKNNQQDKCTKYVM